MASGRTGQLALRLSLLVPRWACEAAYVDPFLFHTLLYCLLHSLFCPLVSYMLRHVRYTIISLTRVHLFASLSGRLCSAS